MILGQGFNIHRLICDLKYLPCHDKQIFITTDYLGPPCLVSLADIPYQPISDTVY